MANPIKLLPILMILFFGSTHGQLLPQFTQYMFNTISINPAYAGNREKLNLTALYRNQWAGLEGNPVTNTFSLHSPLKNERLGMGISYISDQVGDESTDYIYSDLSYSVPISPLTKLSFGLKAGFTNYRLAIQDINDPFYLNNFNRWQPNFGVGLYMSSNRWYAGISSPRILDIDIDQGDFIALQRVNYFAMAGLVLDLSLDIKFRPSVLAKIAQGTPATIDTTAGFLFYEKFWAGLSYRFNDASNFGAFMDYQITRDIRIGYAYDILSRTWGSFSGGTHEVILIFEPQLSKKSSIYKSPRYF